MEIIEILAVVLAVLILVKTIVILMKPKRLMDLGEKVANQTFLLTTIITIFMVVVGYYVVSSVGIVSLMAVMLFSNLLMGLLLIQYPKSYLTLSEDILNNRKKTWLPLLVWLALSVWVLIEVLV
ncbi:hypothetical protein ACFL0E_00085 [Nanoarchaeota archaeon]